jgi:hypothetical protein
MDVRRVSPSNDGRAFDGTLGSDPVHQDRPHHGARLIDLRRCGPSSEADCKNDTVYRLLVSLRVRR